MYVCVCVFGSVEQEYYLNWSLEQRAPRVTEKTQLNVCTRMQIKTLRINKYLIPTYNYRQSDHVYAPF